MTAGNTEELREQIRALQESDPRYRLLFETSGDALLIVGRDGRIVEANEAACDLLGYERDELPGLEARALTARPNRWDRFLEEVEQQASVRERQLACRTRAGRQMDCLLSGAVWRATDGRTLGYQIGIRDTGILGFQSVVRDKTERRRAEVALLDKAEELARTNAVLAEKERLLNAFQRIGQVTLASLDMEQIVDRLAQELVRAGIFRSLMVALVDNDTRSVEVVRTFRCQMDENEVPIPGSVIERTQDLKGLRYGLDDENITAEVARTGQMQVVDGWDERFDSRVDDPGEPTKVSYFIPVQRGDEVLAVLATGSVPAAKEEMLARVDAMQPLLNEVGIALEHARLYQTAQQALAEVQKLKNRLQSENVYLRDEIKHVHNFEAIISQSAAFGAVLDKVEQVATTDATVLILGESGTGKELLARAVHSTSKRQDRPLVKVNCAALPASLIESELFGHEKGAFTGAVARKIGRFELADGGTIFLDEIGDLPLELQAKLLRVLQEGEFERLGGNRTLVADVRVIAATNRDLEEAVRESHFREDLYYRLNVFPLRVPPLRERPDDIPLLVRHFVDKYSNKTGKPISTLPQEALERLQVYRWPGNVRELENIIERAVILSRDGRIQAEHLHLPRIAPEIATYPNAPSAPALASSSETAAHPTTPSAPVSPSPSQGDGEREVILEALEKARWNRRQAGSDGGTRRTSARGSHRNGRTRDRLARQCLDSGG